MGVLTRAEIVSEGQLLAGRDDMETQANGYLQRWLDAVAASWPWPVLQRESTGIALNAGATSLDFGDGAAVGPAEKVLRILDNVWVYNSARTMRSRVRVRHQLSSPVDRIGPTTNTGLPQTMRIFGVSTGVWRFYFDPTPDVNYLLTVPYIELPDPLASGTSVPWYPNDETMVQAVAYKVSEYHNGKASPITQAFQEALAGLVANDRVRYGNTTGVNDTLPLSPAVFRVRDNK